MALFRRFFYRKPPDGLLEISERVYVFDCCFTTDVLGEGEYKVYIGRILAQLREHFPDASFMVFNFREGEHQSQIASILSEYDTTVMDYPRHYEGCPLLTMKMTHHFLRSSESWLSLGHQNVLLMHCERGGWPVLAFMLAGLLIYRKQYTADLKTLDMIYKQAPRELLQLLSPLNPLPSQLRYLQYISRRNVGSEWPPLDRALTLDCIILRLLPDYNHEGGCRPIFRIYGQDPFIASDQTPKVLFSTPKKSKAVRLYKAECELVKIDIYCHIQGDVVLECISLYEDLEREEMMFRVMFNTAFIRSNILMLNRDEIDILWDAKDRFPKDFRAEVLLSEMDAASSIITMEMASGDAKEGLPVEAFNKVQEIFSNVDWLDMKGDASIHVLQHIASSKKVEPQKSVPDVLKEKLHLQEAIVGIKKTSPSVPKHQPVPFLQHAPDLNTKLHDLQSALPRPSLPKIVTQRMQKSPSTPATSSHSLQGSSLPISRYHSAPSALGITALLHDHAAFGSSEVTHSVMVPSLVPSLSSWTVSGLSEPIISKIVSAPLHLPSSLPTLVSPTKNTSMAPPPLPTSTTMTVPATTATVMPPPLLPPPPLSTPPGSAPIVMPPKSSSRVLPLPPATSAWAQQPLSPSPQDFPTSELETSMPCSLSPHHGTSSSVKSSSRSASAPFAPLARLGTSLAVGGPPTFDACTHVPPTYPPTSGANSSMPLVTPPPPRPPPPPIVAPSTRYPAPSMKKAVATTGAPPPPHPSPLGLVAPSTPYPSPSPMKKAVATDDTPPPPPPPPLVASSTPYRPPSPVKKAVDTASAPPPPPPPPPSRAGSTSSAVTSSAPPPPPPPRLPAKADTTSQKSSNVPVPPPPASVAHGSLKGPDNASFQLGRKGSNRDITPPPPANGIGGPPAAPLGIKGRASTRISPRNTTSKRTKLKPLHWVKVTRAMQGSLWAEAQKSSEASKPPEFDMSELESLFSAVMPNSDSRGSADKSSGLSSLGQKSYRVHMIDLRRANNCEILLTTLKMPLSDLMSSLLALDDSVLEVDQIDNLIKFCPTKEEMELLNGFNGDKQSLGKCEQYFLELMKVPRVESKLRVFSFKIQFRSQVADLSNNLNTVNSVAAEIRNSVKLRRIMHTILSLGNALNQGTARGSAIGFRLDSLLKLTDTRGRNNKLTLMHYLCKVLVDKLPELLDFPKDLVSLEVASKIQLKTLAEEMQAISKGLEKVEQELTASENDGPVSETFHKTLKEFLLVAEAEVRALTSLYSNVGRNADALALYFGEDPVRCPFEQVISTLFNFVQMFVRAHQENCKQLELEKKKAQKEADKERMKLGAAKKEMEIFLRSTSSKNANTT